MTTITPVTTTQQTTAFKGKERFAKSMLDKLSKKETIPMNIIDQMNSPISRGVYEGRSKEEIKERLIRDVIDFQFAKIADKYADEFAKLAAKNGYKK